jgi:hypothetical protein
MNPSPPVDTPIAAPMVLLCLKAGGGAVFPAHVGDEVEISVADFADELLGVVWDAI